METDIQNRLPSPKGIALAIMETCLRDDSGTTEVARLVQMDPALSGRLLAQANAVGSGGRSVVSVSDAVARLGLKAVRQLALGFSLIDQYKSGNCKGFDYPGFWSHSLLMAVAMQELGTVLRLGASEELFSCGLLSRVGLLALATAYPVEYARVLTDTANGSALLATEHRVLQTDHLRISSLLLGQWGIPGIFLEAVRGHEKPSQDELSHDPRARRLAQTLHLCLQLAEFLVNQKTEKSFHLSELHLLSSQLGIEKAGLEEAVDRITEQWMVLGQTLNIPSSALPPFADIVRAMVRPDQESHTEWLRVLVVEDDKIIRTLLETWLREECHYTVATAHDGREALALAVEFKPHVVMTDWLMPVMDGIDLCKALRESKWGQNIYVLMLTSVESEGELVAAFAAGVDDYLTKPVNMRGLSARLMAAWRYVRLRDAWERDSERLTAAAAELALINRRLELAALTDPLTELANRRAGLAAIAQAWSASMRHSQPLSLISIDADHFKAINDTYGHAAGDSALQAMAQCLRAGARSEDTVCRWGGEEFLLICPNLTLREGAQMAERLRLNVAALKVTSEGKGIPFTVSMGLASWRADMGSQDVLLADVDKALYAAKSNGRNRVAMVSDGQCRILPVSEQLVRATAFVSPAAPW
jgi:diguanylate cyclase (GGDEF)-like protein